MVLAMMMPVLRAQPAQPAESDGATATAQPVSPRTARSLWSSTVSTFAAALLEPAESSTLNSLTTDDLIIRQFNRAGRRELTHLRDHVEGMSVIMSRTYVQTPGSLAEDIASAIRDVPLPEEIKRRLTPADEAALKRANATASKWISASLFTSGTEPVAIIVLWKDGREIVVPPADEPDADDAAQPKPPRIVMPVFILLKGDLAGDSVKISQICFGDPLSSSPAMIDNGGNTTASGN
jgi:hypothetical protein